MKQIIKRHHISIQNALQGMKWGISTQPNFQVHFLLSFLAVLTGLYLGLNSTEWVLLIFTIFWGLSAEFANTAIEATCDAITTEWRKEIKIAKDVAAGMMLIVALGSIVVAWLLLGTKLLVRLGI